MAFQSLGLQSKNQEQTTWLDEYCENLSKAEKKKVNGTTFVVEKINLSQKGLTLITHCFAVFVWKKTTAYDFLIEAVDVWKTELKGKMLLIEIADVYSAQYDIGVDTETIVQWEVERNGKKLSLSDDLKEEQEPLSNPFL